MIQHSSLSPAVILPPDVIDSQALESLCLDLEPEDLSVIVTLYLTNLPVKIAGMQQAFSNRDSDALVRIAHPLKSTSRQLGARTLGDLCERLEQAGRGALWESMPQLLQAAEQAASAVHPVLQRFLLEQQA
ncbi:MAG: Hpt domain-containing protein [Magnetococcales bacterium]|nr:Hpt domain-containing protein [Magnetococcales bacterium]